jgi:alcohol dehydrogenase class IV
LKGYDLHHGTLNAVLLPHVLDFNGPAVSHRYGDLKQAMGVEPSKDLPDVIVALNDRLGLPDRLAAMGVDDHAIDLAAPLAEKDHTNGTNPRRAGAADYRDLMRAAL